MPGVLDIMKRATDDLSRNPLTRDQSLRDDVCVM